MYEGSIEEADERIAKLKAALSDPVKLELLADWLDVQDAKNGIPPEKHEVQDDLRRWARLAREARNI